MNAEKPQVRSVSKKAKKRIAVPSKEKKSGSCDMNDEGNALASSKIAGGTTSGDGTTASVKSSGKADTLDDPAIVAAGRPRRQPLGRKEAGASAAEGPTIPTLSQDKIEGKPPSSVPSSRQGKTAAAEKGQTSIPRAPRAMRKSRSSHPSTTSRPEPKPKAVEDDSVVCAPRAPSKKERISVPTAATPPRFQASKSKRERTVSASVKANDSVELEGSPPEEKGRSVRFSTGTSHLSTKSSEARKEADGEAFRKEALAQQTALHDAAALLAQSGMPGFPHPSLYPTFLTSSNLAQQQLASAQVLNQLRASVEEFKALKNFTMESAAAYDASRVPCLSERDDINTTTNVYVNNLPSHTTDDDLLRLGACFGPVKSHKAIINQDTGLCKGYGFIMYEHALDAETALQQLPLHGLTTSWAKESFSTKLRKLSDNTTSNVYVSNLPIDMTPHQLEQLFTPHLVVSLRILLDDNGTSRGVGFVRLRDRDTAQECIDKLHGKVLPSQTTPLQARFADSEAQKRLKQTANHGAPVLAKASTSMKPINTSGLLDGSALADPLYLASLQGLQNWAGFGTPQNNSASAFVSPSLGMASPAINYAQWSPSMAANAATNWNLMTADLYGNPLLTGNSANYGLSYANSLFSPSSMASAMNSPFASYSSKSLSPLSFASTPLSSTSPMLGGGVVAGAGKGESGSRPGSTRSKPTYLPMDVHQQHAKALLEAQVGLTFDSPQAEAFGLSQLLLANNAADLYQQQLHQNSLVVHGKSANVDTVPSGLAQGRTSVGLKPSEALDNVLGMSGMMPSDGREASSACPAAGQVAKSSIAPLPFSTPIGRKAGQGVEGGEAVTAALSPIRFSLSADPQNPITIEAMAGPANAKEAAVSQAPTRVDTPMPSNDRALEEGDAAVSAEMQLHDSVTEEGDSLVIDSGNGSAVGPFSSHRSAAKDEGKGIPKSDSGKLFVVEDAPATVCSSKFGKTPSVVAGIEAP